MRNGRLANLQLFRTTIKTCTYTPLLLSLRKRPISCGKNTFVAVGYRRDLTTHIRFHRHERHARNAQKQTIARPNTISTDRKNYCMGQNHVLVIFYSNLFTKSGLLIAETGHKVARPLHCNAHFGQPFGQHTLRSARDSGFGNVLSIRNRFGVLVAWYGLIYEYSPRNALILAAHIRNKVAGGTRQPEPCSLTTR